MSNNCCLCAALTLRTPTIRLENASAESDHGAFAGLRRHTRFNLFACPECNARWKWSLMRGWHHEGQRYTPQAVVGLRLPTPMDRCVFHVAA